MNVPVDRLRQAFKWVEKEREMPPAILIAIHSSIWLTRVEAFRKMEDEYLATGKYQESTSDHRPVLSQLIAEGDQITAAAKKLKLSLLPSGVEAKDLQSTVNSLLITYRCQHGPKNSPKVKDLIGKILDAA